MVELAYAKINLSLDVINRRPDGYHTLSSVMLPIALHDTLHVTLNKEDHLICDDESIPCDENNLIWQAAKAMRKANALSDCFAVALLKRIPSQAGLGGGSSDAAAMLRAINVLCGVYQTDKQLEAIAATIGSDVPFFIRSQPALVQGVGNEVQVISHHTPHQLLIVKPSSGVSTKEAYEQLDLLNCQHPNQRELLQMLADNDYAKMTQCIGNSLEESAMRINAEIAVIKSDLLALGFDAAVMSGSGSAVFGITRKAEVCAKGEDYANKNHFFAHKSAIHFE